MAQGILENIDVDKKEVTISGTTKQVKDGVSNIKINIGEKIEYAIDRRGRFEKIKAVVEEVIEEKVEKPIATINTTEVNVNKNITPEIVDVKTINNDLEIFTFKEVVEAKAMKNYGNKIIEEYLQGNFKHEDISNSQFASFHNKVKERNYSLKSNEIKDFIDERIKRNRGVIFYSSFISNIIEKLDEIYNLDYLNGVSEKVINRELFLLLKKYYRYEGAKAVINGGNNEF